MDKITIERETLKWAIRWHESRIWPGPDEVSVFDALRAALAQKAEPPSMPQGKSLALLDLDSVEHMQGGANGPTIRLRGFINAQTGPTAPQPPIDNAFVADGCEQFSPPAEPAPVPCCGKYETCSHACTPRGKWLGRREAERAALAAQPADAQQEPNMRHPKIQALIGKNARQHIWMMLVEQLVEDPHFETTAMDMEYWDTLHDKLKEKLTAAQPAPAAVPLTDEKIDHTLATTLDEFARTTRGMSHALDVNADITANSRLRRMFARAMIAAAGDKP